MPPPCCKPFRIAELICLLFGFSLLFLLRKYDPNDETLVSPSFLTFLFNCYASLLILLLADTCSQMLRHPIANGPMLVVLITGILFCFIAGIICLVVRFQEHKSHAFKTLNVLSLLSVVSFFATVVFLLDIIIMFRYA